MTARASWRAGAAVHVPTVPNDCGLGVGAVHAISEPDARLRGELLGFSGSGPGRSARARAGSGASLGVCARARVQPCARAGTGRCSRSPHAAAPKLSRVDAIARIADRQDTQTHTQPRREACRPSAAPRHPAAQAARVGRRRPAGDTAARARATASDECGGTGGGDGRQRGVGARRGPRTDGVRAMAARDLPAHICPRPAHICPHLPTTCPRPAHDLPTSAHDLPTTCPRPARICPHLPRPHLSCGALRSRQHVQWACRAGASGALRCARRFPLHVASCTSRVARCRLHAACGVSHVAACSTRARRQVRPARARPPIAARRPSLRRGAPSSRKLARND
jgi:hypothetical protein